MENYEKQLDFTDYFPFQCAIIVASEMFIVIAFFSLKRVEYTEEIMIFFCICEVLVECTLICYLLVTLYFVIVDIKIVQHKIQLLIEVTEQNTITVEFFQQQKDEIKQRINKAKTINSLRILM